MDYLNQIIKTDVKINSITNGLIMIKTKLKLNIATAMRKVGGRPNPYEEKRDVLRAIPDNKEKTHRSDAVIDALGEEYEPRRATYCTSTQTVYGVAQRWVTNFCHHSIFGMNRAYLDDEGRPNSSAILKHMREIAPSVELKEQRLNLFYNKIFAGDFYDNATSLIVVLLQKMHILRFLERLNKRQETYKIPVSFIKRVIDDDPEMMLRKFASEIRHEKFGFGLSPHDNNMWIVMQAMAQWYARAPPEKITDEAGREIINPAYLDYEYSFTRETIYMYDYDDGHSKSGLSYGNHYGFVNNKFIVPFNINKVMGSDEQIISPMPDFMPNSEEQIKVFTRCKGYINCSNLSSLELGILNNALKGNKRSTPFMVDQDISFNFQMNQVNGYYCPVPLEHDAHYTSKQVAQLIGKLVNTHKWFEDALAANRALRYWLAQPANETMEAHWWTHTKRTLNLPQLGLRRAALGMLIDGVGVCISQDSIKQFSQLMRNNDALLIESGFATTCWYWGEYMLSHNAPDTEKLLERLMQPNDMILSATDRADAMYSAMIGSAVPTAQYRELVTYFDGGLDSQKRIYVSFGSIHVDHIKDYGYVKSGDKLLLQALVTPAGVALITGLAGSLMRNTPYSAIFNYNAATRQTYGEKRVTMMNYNDLWALCVIGRWQGQDLHYQHPNRSGVHRSYAANDVSVAQPPVTPATMITAAPYEVKNINWRSNNFGTGIDILINCDATFYWSREISVAQTAYDYGADPCATLDMMLMMPKSYEMDVQTGNTYKTFVITDYDYKLSDFQIERTVLAVPLPTSTRQLHVPEGTEVINQLDNPLDDIG